MARYRGERNKKPEKRIKELESEHVEGKRVAEFKFVPEGSNVTWIIPVRMIAQSDIQEPGQGSRRYDPFETKSVEFGVFLAEPKKFVMRSTDIEVLRYSVFEALGEAFDEGFEEYLWISVDDSGYGFRDNETGLEINYERVWLGKMPDGTECWQSTAHRRQSVQKGRPETGKDRREKKMRALIPATKENEAALERVFKQVENLRKNLQDLFSPKKIQDTIQSLQLTALPAPKGGKKGSKK